MIIFLHGEDSYRLNQARDEIIAKYRAKHGSGFNLFKIDALAVGAEELIHDALRSVSLFSEVKLVLIGNIFTSQPAAEEIEALLPKDIISDPKIVVLATHAGSDSQAKPKSLFDLLNDKKNLVRNFKPLQGTQLQAWLKKEAETRNIKFGAGALAKLAAVGGGDSWARIHNLNKLTNYAGADPITVKDIDLLIKTETEPNVFEFIDALGSGQKTKAFALLCGELAYGRDPYYLLTMVMYQFRNMLIVKDLADRGLSAAQIAQKSNLHPFVVRKMTTATSRLTLTDLQKWYGEIVDLEQGTKQGRRDLEDGLFQLALN